MLTTQVCDFILPTPAVHEALSLARKAELLSGCYRARVLLAHTGRVRIRELAPGRGLEPRTLRLTDRCAPFRNGDLNSLSAAEYHHLPRFIGGVGVRLFVRSTGHGGNHTEHRSGGQMQWTSVP